jgi:catechol 2,3-dioxygenase-like lactoylglutathione lyase family enzyme
MAHVAAAEAARDAVRRQRSMSASGTVNFSIDVLDLAAGLRFYDRVFGFTGTARPFPTIAVLDAGNVTLCLHGKPAGSAPTPAAARLRDYGRHWTAVHLDLHVPAFDPLLTLIRAEGGLIEREFRDTGARPLAFCSDPFGHGFCVIAAAASGEAAADAEPDGARGRRAVPPLPASSPSRRRPEPSRRAPLRCRIWARRRGRGWRRKVPNCLPPNS